MNKYYDREFDIEKLADLLIYDYPEEDANWLDIEFGDNMPYYLKKLGFNEELDNEEYDYIYEEISEDLTNIIKNKLYERTRQKNS